MQPDPTQHPLFRHVQPLQNFLATQPKFDIATVDLAMRVTNKIRLLSRDPSTRTAAIAVDPNTMRIKAIGWNRIVKGRHNRHEMYHDREQKLLNCTHGEEGMMFAGARRGVRIGGCIHFCDFYPCAQCARDHSGFELGWMICNPHALVPDRIERWKESFDETQWVCENFMGMNVSFHSPSQTFTVPSAPEADEAMRTFIVRTSRNLKADFDKGFAGTAWKSGVPLKTFAARLGIE